MTEHVLAIAIGAACLTGLGAQAAEAPLQPLEPKAYQIGIAPSHITVPAEPMLTSLKDWSRVATGIDLYKYYGVQLVNTKWATPIDPKQLVAMAKREGVALGCEFGEFPADDATGERAIAAAFNQIDPIFRAGGEVASIHLDGPVRRQIKGMVRGANGKTLDEIADHLARFYKALHAKHPALQIGLITNFPNWDYTAEFPGVNGHWTDKSGKTYLQVLEACEAALRRAGEKIAFVEVDCPYNYYRATRTRNKDAAVDNAGKFRALHRWCADRNIPLHLIINAESSSGKGFHDMTLDYVVQLRRDGIAPDVFIIQSWYKQPDAQLPETKPNTFTNTALDAIKQIRNSFPSSQ